VFDGRGGKKADSLVVRGTAGSDPFALDPGLAAVNGLGVQFSDVEQLTLDGRAGDDTYAISGLSTATTLVDSKGTDQLDFHGAAGGVSVDLGKHSRQTIFPESPNTLTLKGTWEKAIGSPQGDMIKGNSAANWIEGGLGDDTLWGRPGNDTLWGGAGNDWLYGDAGTDILYGESGHNVLLGGAGNDTLDVLDQADAAGRNLLIGGSGKDTLRGGLGEQVHIGGTTKYDAKPAALAAVMAEWTSGQLFAERCNTLDAGYTDQVLGWIQLKRKDKTYGKGTVLDDRASDNLFGGVGNDWLLGFPNDKAVEPNQTRGSFGFQA